MTDIIYVNEYNEGIEGASSRRAIKVAHALKSLRQIKEHEANLERAKQGANEVIGTWHMETGARAFSLPGTGKCVAYVGSSKRFDQAKAALALVKLGVDADVVEKAFAKATTESVNSVPTVRFTAE